MQRKMIDKRPDRRIAKTRSALGEALFSLLQSNDLEDIAIRDLCERANVARSSFYMHYDSVAELLEDLIAERLHQELGNLPDTASALDWLVDHVTSNRVLFHRTVSGPRGAAVLERFKAGFMQALSEERKRRRLSVAEVELHFLVGGAFEVMRQWSKTWRTSRLPTVKKELRALEARLRA